jgi:hypothetical protein
MFFDNGCVVSYPVVTNTQDTTELIELTKGSMLITAIDQ